jgi:hypothetical protein
MSSAYAGLSLNVLRDPVARINEKQLLQFFATDYIMALSLNRLIEELDIKVPDSYTFPSDIDFDDESQEVTKFFEYYIISLSLQRMMSFTLVNDQRVFELQNVSLESPLSGSFESGTPDQIDSDIILYYKEIRRERIGRELGRANSGSPISPEVMELMTTAIVSIGDLSNNEEENLLQEAVNVIEEQQNIDNLTKLLFGVDEENSYLKMEKDLLKDLLERERKDLVSERVPMVHNKEKLDKIKSDLEKKIASLTMAGKKSPEKDKPSSVIDEIKLSSVEAEIEEVRVKIDKLDGKVSKIDLYLGKLPSFEDFKKDKELTDCFIKGIFRYAGLSIPFEKLQGLLPDNFNDIINSAMLSSIFDPWSKLFPESHPSLTGILVDALPRIEARFRTSTSASESQQDFRDGGIKLMQHFLDSTLTQFRMKEFSDLANNLSPAFALVVFRSLNALEKDDDGRITWSVEDDKEGRLGFNYTLVWITSVDRQLSTIFQFAFDILSVSDRERYFPQHVDAVNGPAMFPGSLDLTGQAGVSMMIDLEHRTQERRIRLKEDKMKNVGGLETMIIQDGVKWLV